MPDTLNYTGAIDIRDPELFGDETNLADMNLYTRKGDNPRKITGQNVANESVVKGNIDALTEKTTPVPAADYVIIHDAASPATNKKVLLANIAGASLSTYSLLANRLHVTGSTGITATLSLGVLSIVIPANGVLTGGSFDFAAADATYSNGVLIQNAIKVRFDNTANSTVTLKAFAPKAFIKTAATISGTQPANISSAVDLNARTDEHGGGITSFVIRDIPSNASAGGILVF